VIAEWIESAKNSTSLKVFGSLENSRDFLFIDDFLHALEAIISKGFKGIVNIGSGEATSLKKVLESVKKVSNTDVQIENSPGRGIDRPEYFLDITKARLRLGWEPMISIEVGIEAAFNGNL
jgi:UDP-glucose 4-epimerase